MRRCTTRSARNSLLYLFLNINIFFKEKVFLHRTNEGLRGPAAGGGAVGDVRAVEDTVLEVPVGPRRRQRTGILVEITAHKFERAARLRVHGARIGGVEPGIVGAVRRTEGKGRRVTVNKASGGGGPRPGIVAEAAAAGALEELVHRCLVHATAHLEHVVSGRALPRLEGPHVERIVILRVFGGSSVSAATIGLIDVVVLQPVEEVVVAVGGGLAWSRRQ